MTRILVTGHLGYIGAVLVTELKAAGHEVAGLDSGLFADCVVEEADHIPMTRRDVRDITPEDVAGYDAIIHLAGLSNDPLALLDPALTADVNGSATVRMARMAREAGVSRFFNSSSCSVYGAPDEPWVDETSTLRPVTPYGESKAFAEQGLRALASPSFCVTSFRNATVFGYSPSLRTDLVVNDLVSAAFLRHEITLNSDGSAWRPLVHVRDVARALVLALSAPADSINGVIVNVGSESQNFRVIEIANMVRRMIPGTAIRTATGAGRDRRSYRTRFERVTQVLPEFRCNYDLAAGVQDLLDNFRRVGLRSTDGLVRLTHLQKLIAGKEVDKSLRLAENEEVTA